MPTPTTATPTTHVGVATSSTAPASATGARAGEPAPLAAEAPAAMFGSDNFHLLSGALPAIEAITYD